MLSATPIVVHTVQLNNDERMPAWFKSSPSAAEFAHEPPKAPAFADLRLPFELWALVFNYVQDGYDIHALARVCKGMRNAAQDAIQLHASFVRRYGVTEVDDYQSVRDLQTRVTRSSTLAFTIRHLTVKCELQGCLGRDMSLLTALVILMQTLPNVRSLSLHIADNTDVLSRLLCIHLPHLRVLSTTPEILRFIGNRPTSDDSDASQIADLDLGSNANASEY
ncbi:hypothetical protein C8Q80DRAFT_681273 [Daedaleopsis nitida]|nr:hypothetical protein C8Q80DRAFT_681273 [Daedaleopsis nitida]